MIRPTCWLPSPMDSEALKLAALTARSRSSSVPARGIVVSYVLEAFFFFEGHRIGSLVQRGSAYICVCISDERMRAGGQPCISLQRALLAP